MAKRLTDLMIERQGGKRKSFTIWDSAQTGLGVRITGRGRRIFILQTRFPGRKRATKRTLGEFSLPEFGVGAAREKAEQWRSLARNGSDPALVAAREKREREAAARAEALRGQNTFGSYAERWISQRKNRRAKVDANEIRFNFFPAWRDRPLHEITARDVRLLFADLIERSAYAARNCWTHATLIFADAVHDELLVASPMASLRKKKVFANAVIESRQRVLNEQEIFAFWRAAGRLGYPAGPCYRLLLLTGARKNEVGGAAWEELHPEMRKLVREAQRSGKPIDWRAVPDEHKALVVPRERFKSDSEHILCLTDPACAIIEHLPRVGPFIFIPSPDSMETTSRSN